VVDYLTKTLHDRLEFLCYIQNVILIVQLNETNVINGHICFKIELKEKGQKDIQRSTKIHRKLRSSNKNLTKTGDEG